MYILTPSWCVTEGSLPTLAPHLRSRIPDRSPCRRDNPAFWQQQRRRADTNVSCTVHGVVGMPRAFFLTACGVEPQVTMGDEKQSFDLLSLRMNMNTMATTQPSARALKNNPEAQPAVVPGPSLCWRARQAPVVGGAEPRRRLFWDVVWRYSIELDRVPLVLCLPCVIGTKQDPKTSLVGVWVVQCMIAAFCCLPIRARTWFQTMMNFAWTTLRLTPLEATTLYKRFFGLHNDFITRGALQLAGVPLQLIKHNDICYI